ncbi:MAG: alkaline ceramidase [Planctomycetaceae bacterium]|nr:alkaline ceramidase [Planctomycetaceae bacterium]MDG2388465.1 alkaline ceramidase [Planctomycetaceae bacterium]
MANAVRSRRHKGFSGLIGLAQTDITPPKGIYARNWGAATHDVADSVHIGLKLSVVTLSEQSGGEPVILIDADLGWWRPLSLFREFQKRLLNELGVKADRLIFALSHTHAASPLMTPDPSLPGSDILEEWLESVFTATVQSVRAALAAAEPAILEWHSGRCQLAAYRDLPDPESDRILCGFNPDGSADETLLVGRISDHEGALKGIIVNYACHPTTLAWDNQAISPDFPGAMRQVISDTTGVPAFFLQGVSGELAPKLQYVGDTEVPERHGKQLAYAALATLYDMNSPATELVFTGAMESGAPLAVWKEQPVTVSVSLDATTTIQKLDLKDWPTADELDREYQTCEDRALAERLRRKRDIRRVLGDGSTFALDVTAWRLGDSFLVGSCCESYSWLQQEIRLQFADYPVACLNLMNGSIGYLPPAELYDRNLYQVWQTPFARGGLERLLEGMVATLQGLLTKSEIG